MAKIGVTGHRVLSDTEIIRKSVDETLTILSKKFSEEPMTLLTCLAEGSDRMVAAQLRSRNGSRIAAVLPLSRADYLNDFATETSRKEFSSYLASADEIIQMPEFSDRDAAYEAAGIYVVDHCDALICIWDGNQAQGRGGTASIVHRARKRRIPVAWIHAGNRQPGTMNPTSLGPEQGRITYENF